MPHIITRGERNAILTSAPAAGGIYSPDAGMPVSAFAPTRDGIFASEVWRTQPSVRKVVDFIARHIASTPLCLYRRVSDTDHQRVKDHPLATILASPAMGVIPYRFWHSIIVDWLIYDRWCAVKLPSFAAGRTLDVLRIQADRMFFLSDGFGRVKQIQVNSPQVPNLDPAECLYDHGYAPLDANGTTPMETLSAVLKESLEAVEYRRSVWKRGGRIPAVVERPKDAPEWGDTARTRFENSLAAYLKGGGREGGWPILEDGMTLKTSDAFKPRDTADLEGRQLTDAEVSSAYHIAPELVGARPGNYSNMQAFREALYGDALGPYYEPLKQVVNTMLVRDVAPNEPDLIVEFDIEAKMRGSFETQAKVLQAAVGRPWMTAAEARSRANLRDLGGDTDELVTPLNVLVGGLASPRDTAPKRRPAPRAKAAPEDLGTFAAERDAFASRLAAFMGKQAAATVKNLDRSAGVPPLAEIFKDAGWDAQLSRLIAPHAQRIAEVGAWSVLSRLNPAADGWAAEIMLPWITKASEGHAAAINAGTLRRVTDAAIKAGRDWPDALDAEFAAIIAAQPDVWAQTIGTASRSFGAHDAAKASGAGTKTWHVNARDPRPSHAAQAGSTVAIDDVFANGARWPGDPNLGADENANCTCTVSYGTE